MIESLKDIQMKKLNLYIVTAGLLLISSCSEWLDLRPENEIVLEDYWKTEAQVNAVLAACYRGMASDPVVERMVVWGELRSDNVVEGLGINNDLLRILNVNLTPTNYYADWSAFYSVINNCNTFLHFAPLVLKSDPKLSPQELKSMEAEVLAIRSMMYFYLVRAYKDVPLVLEPSLDDTQNYYVSKSTERVILDRIIADLLVARQDVRKDYGKGAYNKGRFTANAVNALLADIYLWDQKYDLCVNTCNEILTDKSFELVEGEKLLNSVFYTGNSTESIFELQFDKDNQYNNSVNWLYGFDLTKDGQLSFPKYLTTLGSYSPFEYPASATKESMEDIREKVYFGKTVNGNGYSIYKYALSDVVFNSDESVTPVYRSVSNTVNWIIYRLPDIILMKAEALVQLNRTENDLREALRLVNRTYLRANINLKGDSLLFGNYADQSIMEKLVLRERQREFLFEGKRWFDLMRIVRRKQDATAILAYISPKLSGDNMQIRKLSVIDALYMPIQKSEIDINSNLIQNPFYDENSEFMK